MEKRRAPRFDSRLFVAIKSMADYSKKGRGVMVDLSLSGFGLETESDLIEGNTYECSVEVPLKIKAKVVRSIQGGQMKKYGCRIQSMSLLEKFLLKKLLRGDRVTDKV